MLAIYVWTVSIFRKKYFYVITRDSICYLLCRIHFIVLLKFQYNFYQNEPYVKNDKLFFIQASSANNRGLSLSFDLTMVFPGRPRVHICRWGLCLDSGRLQKSILFFSNLHTLIIYAPMFTGGPFISMRPNAHSLLFLCYDVLSLQLFQLLVLLCSSYLVVTFSCSLFLRASWSNVLKHILMTSCPIN